MAIPASLMRVDHSGNHFPTGSNCAPQYLLRWERLGLLSLFWALAQTKFEKYKFHGMLKSAASATASTSLGILACVLHLLRPKHQNVSKTSALGSDFASEKTLSRNTAFGGARYCLKQRCPRRGSLNGNSMLEATVPSEGGVERKF